MTNEIDAIRLKLGDPDPFVRRDACEELSLASGGDAVVPELVELLADADTGVREAAVNALTHIGTDAVARAVAPLLMSEDVTVRNMGIEILGNLKGVAVDTLATLLDDPDDDVVKFAVDILATIDDYRVAGHLSTKLTTHPNPNVRAAVALCLGKIKAPGSLDLLLGALKDDEEWVRFSALEGIGLLGDPRALDSLLEVIEGAPSLLLRESAIEAAANLVSIEEAPRLLIRLVGFIQKGMDMPLKPAVDLLSKAMHPGSAFSLSSEAKPALLGFFIKALREAGRSEKLLALKGLTLLGSSEALGPVLSYMDSLSAMDEETEAVVASAIVSMAGRATVPTALVERVEKDGKYLATLIRCLGDIGGEQSLNVLEKLIDRTDKDELREVVSAIEAIGSAASVEVLLRTLSHKDGHARNIAARAAASVAGDGATAQIYAALKKEKYRDVAEGMTDALASIASAKVNECFVQLLKDESPVLREMGARGLGLSGDEGSLAALRDASLDANPAVRKAAYKSIAQLGIPDALEDVLRGLDDADADVKLHVLKGLSGWSGDRVRDKLIALLADDNLWVRYHAVTFLGEMNSRECEERLISMLGSEEPPVVAAIAKALEKIGSERSATALEGLLDHPDTNVRSAVESALEALRC